MRRRIIGVIAGCVAVFILVCTLFVYHDVRVMGRHDLAESSMANLAKSIENSRLSQGSYPPSLADLVSKSDDLERNYLSDLLLKLEQARLILEYRRATNTFKISISGIDSWRRKRDKIEKEYKAGDLRK
jgi:hypothetical protein